MRFAVSAGCLLLILTIYVGSYFALVRDDSEVIYPWTERMAIRQL